MMKKSDGESRNIFLEIGFYLQHGIFGFAFGAVRLVVCTETKLSYEELRRLRCSVCRRTCEGLYSLHFDERHVAVVGIELWMSPWVSCLVFGESMRYLHWGGPEVNWELACRERGYASDRHSQFWGDRKLCLCEACWMHLIYIQLGFLVRNP